VAGDAEACRSGSRRYLRLRQGVSIPRSERGWDIIESLRRWHGDKRAAEYVAHKDRQSERLRYQAPSPTADCPRYAPGLKRQTASVGRGQVSASEAPRSRGVK